jgi:hypothetical protein
MIKTAEELAPILTIHHLEDGQYAVRISDLRWRSLIVDLAKLLPDARSLILVTPASIKVLRVSDSTAVGGRPGAAVVAQPPRDAGTEAADPEENLDPEMLAAIKEQEGHEVPGEPGETAAPAVEPDSGMRVVRRRKPNGQFAGHSENCGRCRGTGQIRIIEANGEPGEAACGVCQGTGVIQRYGSRR